MKLVLVIVAALVGVSTASASELTTANESLVCVTNDLQVHEGILLSRTVRISIDGNSRVSSLTFQDGCTTTFRSSTTRQTRSCGGGPESLMTRFSGRASENLIDFNRSISVNTLLEELPMNIHVNFDINKLSGAARAQVTFEDEEGLERQRAIRYSCRRAR